jgi:hypothetical protein
MEKLAVARAGAVKSAGASAVVSESILSNHGVGQSITVGNWVLSSRKESELTIHNTGGQQVGKQFTA